MWQIAYGVEHMVGDACPFCNQEAGHLDLVKAFKGYFSAQFAKLVSDIDAKLETLKAIYGASGATFDATLSGNASDLSFWRTVCDLGTTPALSPDERTAVRRAIEILIGLLEAKKAKPLAATPLSDKANIEAALVAFATYQAALAASIKIIQEARSSAVSADLAKAQEIWNKRKALKSKLAEPLKSEVASWIASTKRRAKIESEKKTAQAVLKKYVADTVGPKQDAINDLLMLFGANFQITDTKASFVGREPNADYSLALGAHTVKVGDSSVEEPSFTTVLSAGDKSTLALAFFIIQIRDYGDLSSSTIVFDDPFTSQDIQRQWETTSQLRGLAKDSAQIIVFSHDPRFLALIEKNAPSATCSTFQLMCDDAGIGSISSWSSTDELKELYVRQAERIREFASTGIQLKGSTPEALIKELRPFLEDFIRARFPGRFAQLVMLDGMANEIEAAGADDPLCKDLPTFRAINEYSRDSMHGGATPPDPIALRAQCKRIVGVIGSY